MHLSYLDPSYIILSMKVSQKWQSFFFFHCILLNRAIYSEKM